MRQESPAAVLRNCDQKMKAADYSEIFVSFYHMTWRHIPEAIILWPLPWEPKDLIFACLIFIKLRDQIKWSFPYLLKCPMGNAIPIGPHASLGLDDWTIAVRFSAEDRHLLVQSSMELNRGISGVNLTGCEAEHSYATVLIMRGSQFHSLHAVMVLCLIKKRDNYISFGRF